jgi:hypothetical protein
METSEVELVNPSAVLAFYSCCTGKPHRFQFIYLNGGYQEGIIKTDSNRVIKVENC